MRKGQKMITLKIVRANGEIVKESKETEEVFLFYEGEYEEGDSIMVSFEKVPGFYHVQLDDARGSALVYVTGDLQYKVPFGEKRTNISPKAFLGNAHYLYVREAQDFEVSNYRNVALNVWDQHHLEHVYPHAVANVETRGEMVFAAQNAIDGVNLNYSHGNWPYASWGINQQDDATIRVEFGREVSIDRILLYTRADFPHDNWWKQVSFTFSDGSQFDWKLEKQVKPHEISFPEKTVCWIEMHDMKKADDPSPFPALTQLEVYGRN